MVPFQAMAVSVLAETRGKAERACSSPLVPRSARSSTAAATIVGGPPES